MSNSDYKFIKKVAGDFGFNILKSQAKKAYQITKCDYYELLSYFGGSFYE